MFLRQIKHEAIKKLNFKLFDFQKRKTERVNLIKTMFSIFYPKGQYYNLFLIYINTFSYFHILIDLLTIKLAPLTNKMVP